MFSGGKFLGAILKSGDFDGKPYSYYNVFFEVDAKGTCIGRNIATFRCSSLFPDLNEKNIGKEFVIDSCYYDGKNRLSLGYCHLKGV